MSNRPILFSGPMVRALLSGTKTQTRRVFKPQPTMHEAGDCTVNGHRGPVDYLMREIAPKHWLRIQTGDRLWVRETSKPIPESRPGGYFVEGSPFFGRDFFYQADQNCPLWADGAWKPSIHMPRWASRLTLTVTEVRVERLQDISEADALAEGVLTDDDYAGSFAKEYCHHCGGSGVHGAFGAGYGVTEVDCAHCETPQLRYRNLWNHINGPGSWEANPWVAAYTFTVEHRNIDEVAA